MARFLVAAIDLDSGYKQGELVTAQPDNHVWTQAEGLPLFWQVDTPSIGLSVAKAAVGPLMEPAMPGDPELDPKLDPEDRFIRRGRGHVRLFPDSLPRNKRNQLVRTGKISLTLGQTRAVFRKMVWNRKAGAVVEAGVGAFG